MARIRAQILKGFRDYLPAMMAHRLRLMDTARRVFESFGFEPLETPLLEYSEVLLGKYGDEGEKQFYRFTDHGGRDVCLRYDLTVPLSRVVAMYPELPRPFKRYQIGTVFRGEHPKRGRFREFTQCDVDIVGSASPTADAECIAVGTALLDAIGVRDYVLRVNHRQILNALFAGAGVRDPQAMAAIFRIVDKLDKVGQPAVAEELSRTGLGADAVERITTFLGLRGTLSSVMAELQRYGGGDDLGGVAALREVLAHVAAFGVPLDRIEIDVSIARGIDYYTGLVYETVLKEKPELGSIMSGGRYDHLIELLAERPVPAVGISMGLDRLVAALDELGELPPPAATARVLVVAFGRDGFAASQAIARTLRQGGVPAEVSHEHAKVGPQYKYADRRAIPYVLVQGDDERARGVVKLKELATGGERETTLDQAVRDLAAAPR